METGGNIELQLKNSLVPQSAPGLASLLSDLSPPPQQTITTMAGVHHMHKQSCEPEP
jgi:hypothetical protein